jgi:hypothetical protein
VADLATLLRRQNALESDQSAIEAALSDVLGDLLALRAARRSANRGESQLMGCAAEIQSVHSASETALEALSRRSDWAEERVLDANNEKWMEHFYSGRIGNHFLSLQREANQIRVFALWDSTALQAIPRPNIV